jgi:hypothetical protein
LQIVLHADRVQHCKPLLIFHGKGNKTGWPVSGSLQAEYKEYDNKVVVKFNNKAYANTDTILEWIKNQYAYSSANYFRHSDYYHQPRLPSLDVFKGQLNDEAVAAFTKINYTCSYIPGGTIGFI